MDARQFYNMVVKLRKAQLDYEKLPSTRNAQFKSTYETLIDAEIERVEKIKQNEANKQQQKLL
jgi:hypothetical protein